ncbi:septum site-determining protein MinC [Kozakia baliensis]|uniref:septum site-determining protein MinC n=1 Tax=Kozakia baliensis TaxID=153496 RepID=UPI00345C00B0
MSSSPSAAPSDHAPEPGSGPVRIRARGRSFLALVLSPERPLAAWLQGLDDQIARSSAFFAGKPIILDLGLLAPEDEGLADLQAALVSRNIRLIGIEGADQAWPQLAKWEWPATLEGGRASGAVEIPETENAEATAAPPAPQAGTLLIEQSIRSGQSVMHLEGDVVVIGSVASGSEIVAGGSIHVYGALRGRAIAGVGGHMSARIYATRMRGELLAVDGYYMTAEEMDPALVDRPAQAFLQEDRMLVIPLT